MRPSFTLGALAGLALPAVLVVACGGSKTSGAPDASDPSAVKSAPPAAPTASTTGTAATSPSATGSTTPKPGDVAVPPSDAGVMNNANPDASHDRSASELGEIISKNRDRFRACYEQALGRNPKLEGAFVLLFTLNADGSFKSVSYDKDKSDIKDEPMAECMYGVVKGLSFPASKRGKETTVSYPFGFKPKAAAH